jgi:hypothetical protein
MRGEDVKREVDELTERYVVHRVIPDDKERALKEFLAKLKQLDVTDGLNSRKASGKGLASGQNWLLQPLRLWEELCYLSTRGRRWGRLFLFGPVTRVDADTVLLVVNGHEHPYRLVWGQGTNFIYRKLSQDEHAAVSMLYLWTVRELGFVDFSWPPDLVGFGDEPEPKRPTRRRRGS